MEIKNTGNITYEKVIELLPPLSRLHKATTFSLYRYEGFDFHKLQYTLFYREPGDNDEHRVDMLVDLTKVDPMAGSLRKEDIEVIAYI